MRAENREEIKKTISGGIETPGDFSVIVDPCIWKRLKNYGEDYEQSREVARSCSYSACVVKVS